jgi:hypothetical protein
MLARRRARQSGVGFIGREWTLVFWRGKGWVQGECGGRRGILAETRGAEKRRVIEWRVGKGRLGVGGGDVRVE